MSCDARLRTWNYFPSDAHSTLLVPLKLPPKVSVALAAHHQAWCWCLALFRLGLGILGLCLGSFPVIKGKLLEIYLFKTVTPVARFCCPKVSSISRDIFRDRHPRRLLWSHTGSRGRGLPGGGAGGGHRPVLLVPGGVKCRKVCLHRLRLQLGFPSFLCCCKIIDIILLRRTIFF